MISFYSDNFSHEVKKGMGERKTQGLYYGTLPFGATKGSGGLPVPEDATIPGLKTSFHQAARGKTDREIACYLNEQGYHTAGSKGNKLFSNSSVTAILTNPFNIGYLPDGNGGYIRAKHKPYIEQEIWGTAKETPGETGQQHIPVAPPISV